MRQMMSRDADAGGKEVDGGSDGLREGSLRKRSKLQIFDIEMVV